jgi:hypothetical protein
MAALIRKKRMSAPSSSSDLELFAERLDARLGGYGPRNRIIYHFE